MAKPDIVDRLKKVLLMRPGTADSDINVLALSVDVPYGDVHDAIAEIERLRGTAGQSFTDIKQEIKRG